MRKTGSIVEQDFYTILKDETNLSALISGGIYKSGMRPVDSKLEDAVVSFAAGLDGQVQAGVVNINIYIPDIIIDGYPYRDSGRCREIEVVLDELLKEINNPIYDLSLSDMIRTFKEEDMNQHFINAKVNFRLITV